MPVKNYMEEAVFGLLDDVISQLDVCKCQRCKDDIAAIALNNLKPHYIATEMGEVYTKINNLKDQFYADITKEIVKAAEIVKKNPRH